MASAVIKDDEDAWDAYVNELIDVVYQVVQILGPQDGGKVLEAMAEKAKENVMRRLRVTIADGSGLEWPVRAEDEEEAEPERVPAIDSAMIFVEALFGNERMLEVKRRVLDIQEDKQAKENQRPEEEDEEEERPRKLRKKN